MSYQQYFFGTIDRILGQPAPDWKAVLESLPGRGFGVNPKSGEIQSLNAPHHGITVMIDAGGNARGRIWLPSDGPPTHHDGNQWYTHEIQVIADGPTPGSMVWAWQDKGGAPERPFVSQPAPAPEPQRPEPAPEPVPAAQQDADAIVRAIEANTVAVVAKLDELKVSVNKAAQDLGRALPGVLGLFGRREGPG
jgi:hypothetical protein